MYYLPGILWGLNIIYIFYNFEILQIDFSRALSSSRLMINDFLWDCDLGKVGIASLRARFSFLNVYL